MMGKLNRFAWRCGAMALLGGVSLVGPGAARAQPTLPEIPVEGPRIPKDATPPDQPPEQPPEPPRDPEQDIPQSIRDFTYSGSPFGQFDFTTRSLTGSPGSIFNSARSFTTLDQARIAERASGNVPNLLQGIPGVLIQRTQQGGGSLIIRGRNGNQNLIMVDGVPINDAGWRFSNVQYLNTIDPGIIERIEVIRGPEGVLYGSGAVGGVLNIITKSRKDFSHRFGVNGDIITSYGTALHDPYNRVEFTGNFENLGFYAGGSYYSPGQVQAGQGINFPGYATAYNQMAGNMRLDWHADDYWTVTAVYQRLLQNSVPRTDRFALPQLNPTRFVNQPTFTDNGRDFFYTRLSFYDENACWINGMQLTFDYQRRTEQEQELLLASRNAANRLVGQNTRLRVFNDEVNYGGLDFRAFTNFSEYHTLTYGMTYRYDTIDSIRLQQTATSVGGSLRNRPVTQISPNLPPNGRYGQYGVFLMDRFDVTDWWTINLGGRYSLIHAQGTARTLAPPPNGPVNFDRYFLDWVGEAGSVVKLTDSLNWVASISGGYRAPNLEDLGATEITTAIGPDNGNINLNTERVVNYETGFKGNWDWLQGAATFYYADYPDQIVRRRFGNNTARGNTVGYIYGPEFEGALFLTKDWSLFSTFSYTFGSDLTLDEPLRVPPLLSVVGTRYAQRRQCWGWFTEGWAEMAGRFNRLGFFDRQDIRIPDGGEAAWQTLNLRVGVDHVDYGQLSLSLLNLFDQNYRVLGSGIDAPGFEFRVGYQLSF